MYFVDYLLLKKLFLQFFIRKLSETIYTKAILEIYILVSFVLELDS